MDSPRCAGPGSEWAGRYPALMSQRPQSKRAMGIVVSALAIAVLLGSRLVQVHSATWEWTLRPDPASVKVEFNGRSYLRGGTDLDRPDDLVAVGHTLGGGSIFTAGESGPLTPTVIYVGHGTTLTGYSLSGGP